MRPAPRVERYEGDATVIVGEVLKMPLGIPKKIETAIATIPWPLYFFGPVGTGKTCAASCVYQHWPGHEFYDWDRPFWCEASTFLLKLAMSDDPRKHLKRVGRAAIFILDDIGRRELSAAQRDRLQDVLNVRGNKPAIYTSNHHPRDLAIALADERLCSRLLAGGKAAMIEFAGKDRRLFPPEPIPRAPKLLA